MADKARSEDGPLGTDVAAWAEGAEGFDGSEGVGESAGESGGASAGVADDGTEGGASGGDAVSRLRSVAKRSWQIPLLLIGGALLVGGGTVAVSTAPRPEFEPILDAARELQRRAQYADAARLLNREVFPYLGGEWLTTEQRGEYHLLAGRAIARWQRTEGIDKRENHEIVAFHLGRADELGAPLDTTDLLDLGDAHIAMGRPELAEALAVRLDDAGRVKLFQSLIDLYLNRAVPETERALALLGEVQGAGVTSANRLWAASRQADLLLAQGFAGEAVDYLLPQVTMLEGGGLEPVGHEALGELYVRLARAYLELRDVAQAGAAIGRADELLPPAASVRAEVVYHGARLAEIEGRLDEARDGYEQIADRYTVSRVHGLGLLRLAETESAMASTGPADGRAAAVEAAARAYERVVDLLRVAPPERPTREEVTASLLARHAEMLARRRAEDALRFARIGARLHGLVRPGDDAPAGLVLALGRAHRAIADDLLRSIGGERASLEATLRELPPGLSREAQRHLTLAGFFLAQHAELSVVESVDTYADSLWESCEAFDLAGQREEAAAHLRKFVSDLPTHPRHPQARFRLARVRQATGAFAEAASIYRELRMTAGETGYDALDFAELSRVPLAQCLLGDADPGNDDEGESLLLEVVSRPSALSDPRSDEYRSALRTLAGRYADTGRYAQAIASYAELTARVEDPRERAMDTYRMADAHRRLAERIGGELSGEGAPQLTERRRRELAGEREGNLREAMGAFARARDGLGAISGAQRTMLESTLLRNSMFYLGDCAFDLGDDEAAVEYYLAARDRYPDDPASLVALTQVVAAHIRRGDLASARAVNERARRLWERLPPEAWDDPMLPMGREAWERWLESNRVLYETLADGSAG